jgi:hypothetical protein
MNAQDKENITQLLAAIRGGSDLDTACHFAGLSTNQVYRWLERGKIESERIESGKKPVVAEKDFVAFWNDLKKARADAIVRNVSVIQKAGQENWKAAAWWLERTMPEKYGKRSINKPAVNGEPPHELTAGES